MAIRTYIDLYILWRRDYSIIFVFVAVEKAAAVYHFFASFFLRLFSGFPCGSAGKESTCNAGDLGSIPGLGRYPGEGKSYPFQYSHLENSMDFIVHGVT